MDLVKVSIEPKNFAKYILKRVCLRDFNLSEKQELKQPKNYVRSKQGTVRYLQTLANSRPLHGGRSLAKHPLSCHPQRSVWQSRKGEKMREKGEKRENWNPNFIYSKKKTFLHRVYKMAYIALQTK